MDNANKETRSNLLAEKVKDLKIGLEDRRDLKSLKFEITERLLQIQGSFFAYDVMLDKEFMCAENVFLSIDKVGNLDCQYVMNVVDLPQKISYTYLKLNESEKVIFNGY